MPGRGIMRAKQLRAGSLGQGTQFYYMGSSSFSRIAGAQGFGKTNPSVGSLKSLGVMKQNRNAGGNTVCKETMIFKYYYTQEMVISSDASLTKNTLIYLNGSTQLIGKLVEFNTVDSSWVVRLASESNILPLGPINPGLSVTLVTPTGGYPGLPGTIENVAKTMKNIDPNSTNCDCRGPKSYCSNCSGRNNPRGAITGGSTYSSTTGFTLTTH